jgi:hypothetical protein
MEPMMTRFEVSRHVVADPAGVALLLAEPASWTEADDAGQAWVVSPPRRVGSRFVAVVEVTAASGRLATGQVTVKPLTDAGSEIRLVIRSAEDLATHGVDQVAVTFVALLAERAQARSMAA